MKLTLKKDWDISIHPPTESGKPKGFFVGRHKELNLLTNELLRRDSGAILVTGYRGVGKTSLVYKAISNVRAEDENTIVVLITASQLQAESETAPSAKPSPKRLIIESIIRRLYATTRDDKRLKEFKLAIENLYRKAVAAEVKFVEEFRSEENKSIEEVREEISEWQITEKGIAMLIYVCCWSLGAVLQFIPKYSDLPLIKLASMLLAIPIPFAINLFRKTKRVESESSQTAKKAEEVYQFDNSIGNLEFDLEKLHRDLSAKGKKLIYVIDELDKLEVVAVGSLLKFFKNLFTLSEAVFIFIADEAMYNFGWDGAQPNAKRPLDYTYFTSRYFLSRPLYSDLKEYWSQIVQTTEGEQEDADILFRSLCFVAGNDFFDLRIAIADRLTAFSGGLPVIELPNIPEIDHQRARFHRVLTSLFENKYMASSPSKWQENETLHYGLFTHTKNIFETFAGVTVSDPQESTLIASLRRDCNNLLCRSGALEFVQRNGEINIRGFSSPINNYRHTGGMPFEPSEKLNEPSEYERRFIGGVIRYCEFVLSLRNAFLSEDNHPEISTEEFWDSPKGYLHPKWLWQLNVLSPIEKHLDLMLRFQKEHPLPAIDRTVIEQADKEVESVTQTFFANTIPNILSKMLVETNPALGLLATNIGHDERLFGGDAQKIRRALNNQNFHCVCTADMKRQLIFVAEKSETIKRLGEELKSIQESHRVVDIGEFSDSSLNGNGLFLINITSPQALKSSLQRFLREAKSFFRQQKET